MESILTAPTLFIGLGSLLWLPLTLALGRRPVFLIVALIQLVATLGAGFSTSFYALLTCACILGLGQGFSITAVSVICDSASSFLTMIVILDAHRHDLRP